MRDLYDNFRNIKLLRQRMRDLAFEPGEIKAAELGGSEDTPFEQAFSNLAHSYVKDKAPKLLDYEVGFQQLEKNQENTKAVGVFGFKLGKQWLYIPVFFLNGDLKGHELLYIKNQDAFVPLAEEWIDHILGKKPSMLGDGVNRNLSLLGIMPPNLYQMSRTPEKFASDNSASDPSSSAQTGPDATQPVRAKVHTKAASSGLKMASWARDFMPQLAYLATTPLTKEAKYDDVRDLESFLKEAGEDTFRFLIEKVGQEYPTIIQAIDSFYGPDMLSRVAKHIAQQKQASDSNSLTKKKAALSAAGEPLPSDWDGRMQEPDKVNGGVGSYGREAWNSAQTGRRKSKAHKGHLGELARMYKRDHSKVAADKKDNRETTITPSVLGPMVNSEQKHKAISVEQVNKNPDLIHNLSADEREKLLKERIVFRDNRGADEVTIAYNVQTPLRLQNPDHTGIYHVLVKPDRFEKCLVIMGPYNHKRRQTFCTVVCLEGKKQYVNTHPANVWTNGEYDNDAWKAWLKDLKDADSGIPLADRDDPWKDRRRFIVIGPTGEGTVPLQAREEYSGDGEDESVVYEVRFEDYSSGHRPAYLPDHGQRDHDLYESGYGPHCERLILTKRPGTKLTARDGSLCVPANFKMIQVRDEEGDHDDEPLHLGSLADVQMSIMGQTKPLRIVSDGRDVTVNENRMDKTSALIHLFEDHGLTEKVARHLLDEAVRRKTVIECRLKYPTEEDATEKKADSDDMIRSAPNAPPFPEPYMGYDPMTGGNVPTMQESEFNVRVPDMSAAKTDRSIYYPFGPDPKAMQVAQQAARTGQKEVFDTAMLGGLLKATSPENLVDKYIGDLMKGLDRLGRILFQYYWHGEEFEDRYGKQDMPELEDGLRNTFEGMGDVILALKRKSVQPYMEDYDNTDLSEVANQ